jgi:hypothetical protein
VSTLAEKANWETFSVGRIRTVPDKRSRDLEVVVVRGIINLRYWEFGMGREWEGVEEGEVSLRVT